MTRTPSHVLLALMTALAVAGCSGGSSDSTSSTAAASAGKADSADSADSAAGGSAQAGAAAPEAAGKAGTVVNARVASGPALIRTGELSVQVRDVRRAADAAGALARGAGGAVQSEERSGSGEKASAVVVLRVPPRSFDQVLTRLSSLGKERDRQLGTTDVTDQVVDLDSRIGTQEASVARVRALLDRAGSLGEVVQIEGELTKRTADLESLQARLAALDEQVDLSTLTLRLDGDADPAAAPASGPLGFRDGLAAGWDAILVLGRAAGVTLGAVLPFSPLLLVAGALLWRSRSRRPVAA